MVPALRDFVAIEKAKKRQTITVFEWMKHQNHEIWRTCQDCNEEFDLRKEPDLRCPKCRSKNINL